MKKAFKVFLFFVPLLFLWLLILYGIYPLTHRDYILDIPTMIERGGVVFETTFVTWWRSAYNDVSNDFSTGLKATANFLSQNEEGNFFLNVINGIKAIYSVIAFFFLGIGKILFYYPLTLIYYVVVFFVKLTEWLFNPSFINVGEYYREEWSLNNGLLFDLLKRYSQI